MNLMKTMIDLYYNKINTIFKNNKKKKDLQMIRLKFLIKSKMYK